MDEIVADAMRHRARGTVAGNRQLNKSLLDTDILSEIGKAIDPVVARNATAYRTWPSARYTLGRVASWKSLAVSGPISRVVPNVLRPILNDPRSLSIPHQWIRFGTFR